MKLRMTFKDPDHAMQFVDGTPAEADEFDGVNVPRVARALVRKFVVWDEYVTIEYDTLAGTARVVADGE